MPRVLVVDDSVVMRDIVRAHLAGLGLDLDVASSGDEALTRFGTGQPIDLVITDYAMPGLNGLEFARRVKEKTGTIAPKIILISANKELRERDLLATGCVDAFFPKPVDGTQLAARVQTMLALHTPPPAVVPSSRRARSTIRVVIADDTEVGRTLLARVLKVDPEIDVVGMARDGQGAVDLAVRENPQLILLDAMMPGLDGVAATRRIMALAPTRVVIVSDQQAGARPAAQIFAATEAGALDVIARPSWGDPMSPQAVALREKIKMLAEIPVVRRWSDGPRSVRSRRGGGLRTVPRATVVAICASTGGPAAIAALLPGLAPIVGSVPILIVQHVLAGFDEALAEWLTNVTEQPVRIATNGMPLRGGVIALAPEGKHMMVQSLNMLGVIEGPPVGNHRPSGTPLFESVARFFGEGTLAVMLTGMGSDGVDGLRAVKSAGGSVIVQSPDSCVVSGMPGAAIARGYADIVLPLEELAPEILERVRAPARSRH